MSVWRGSVFLGLLIVLCLQFCVKAQNQKQIPQCKIFPISCSPDGNAPQQCCFRFRKEAMRVGNIIKYEKTRSDCPHPGVIFIKWDGKSVCAKPEDRWVTEAIKKMDKRLEEQ